MAIIQTYVQVTSILLFAAYAESSYWPCHAGQYDQGDGHGCEDCPGGSISADQEHNELFECDKCELNTFSNHAATSCIDCPTGTFTESTGSASSHACLRNVGRYWHYSQ